MVKDLGLKSHFEVNYAIFHFQDQLGLVGQVAGPLRAKGGRGVV